MGCFRAEAGSGNLDFESEANFLYQPLKPWPQGLAILEVKRWRPRQKGKKCFPWGSNHGEDRISFIMALPAYRSSDWSPAHHAPRAVTQRDDVYRDQDQLPHGCPPPAALEEAHPSTQQVFLILSQMGNSFCRIILMHETRMFSVTSYIPLFTPSFNYFLSSLDVLHWITYLYNTVLAVSRGCSQPARREKDQAV